jgi:PAS domain S-box-containing protein
MTPRLRVLVAGAGCPDLESLLRGSRRVPVDVERVPITASLVPSKKTHELCIVVGARPAADATELVRRARQEGTPPPVLCIATAGDPDDEAAALRGGASDYLLASELTRALLDRAIMLALEQANIPSAIQRSEARFRTLIEVSPEAILVHQRGILLYVNPATLKLLGYESKIDLVARPVHEIVHGEDLGTVWTEMRAFVEQGRPSPKRECRLLRRDGSVATTEMVAIPILLESEAAVLSIAHDVTERKEMQARLMFADRMVSMGTLAAGVAHEVNNPLSYIIANLDFLIEELAALPSSDRIEDMRKAAREAQEGAARVRHIVRDLRTFSRADEDRRSAVDLRRVLESASNMAYNEIRYRARLVREIGTVPLVYANEARLGQVFLNLLVNAAHAIDEGAPMKNEIRIVAYTEAGNAIVEVRDTGCGMSPETMERVFLPFFTTKPEGLGTGLGLAICQSIVSSLGGEISMTSTVGAGTTFRVRLPPAPKDAQPETSSAKPVQAKGRGRILILDDEVHVGTALARALQREHDVVALVDAREALARLKAGARFDIIFCDLMMPHMSGMDFFQEVEQTLPEVAPSIVFFTGGAFTPRTQQFLDRVPNARLEKPPSLSALRELLRERVR